LRKRSIRPATRPHINLDDEYDFSDEELKGSVGSQLTGFEPLEENDWREGKFVINVL
jgi:hypothetical protein